MHCKPQEWFLHLDDAGFAFVADFDDLEDERVDSEVHYAQDFFRFAVFTHAGESVVIGLSVA